MDTNRCRICSAPRPAGYSVTCGASYCQETDFLLTRNTKSILSMIRALGLSASYRDGEFRITFKGITRDRAEAAAYYTTDRSDAIYTARHIARHHLAA